MNILSIRIAFIDKFNEFRFLPKFDKFTGKFTGKFTKMMFTGKFPNSNLKYLCFTNMKI